jgi:uncharacterized HAD superfamily protein
MKFGFDVDDTLIRLREHAFHLYNKKLEKTIPIEDFHALTTLEIHKPFGLSDQEGSEMWRNSMEEIYFTDCPPFPFAVEMVNQLINDGHEVYYITSRPPEHCNRTKKWLMKAGFPVNDQSFYCGMNDSEKIQIIMNLKLDYYFDDKPAVLETLQDTVCQVYKKSSSYNRHISLPEITSWSELNEIIKRQQI